MLIVLVRHGETESNRERLALGHADAALNETGLKQAASVANLLGEDVERGLRVEAVYTSPLLRARETAEAIAARLGVPVSEAPGLIEMDVGEMDGLSGSEMRERHPEFMRAWLGSGVADLRMPGGGESLAQVQERAWAAVERIRDAHPPDAAVVAVTHNFVMRTVVCRALSIPLAEFRRFEQDLASITRLEFRGARTLITILNERCHLEGL